MQISSRAAAEEATRQVRMRWNWLWTLAGGLGLALAGWFAWAGYPLSSQEALANAVKAQDFFEAWGREGLGAWWSSKFLGGASLAPQWGTVVTLAWIQLWVAIFGLWPGAQLAMLACVPVAALTARAFVKALAGSELAAGVAGLAYAAAPALWMRIMGYEHTVVVCALAVLPVACLGVLRLARHPSTWSALFCAAAGALLALTYSKAAMVALPGLGAFALWGLWKHCGLAAWLRPPVLAALLGGGVFLALLPNLPALREAQYAALFEFGPLEGWRQSFSSKSGAHFFDRLGWLSRNFRGDFAPTTAAGAYFPGVVPFLLIGAALVCWRQGEARSREMAGKIRLCLALALFCFWLSHGPFSPLSGTLRALDASARAPDVIAAVLWGSLAVQGWIIWRLLPATMPLRRPCAVFLMAAYFLIPGFDWLSRLPFYRDLRAPFDFYQVGGVIWVCAAAGLAAASLDRLGGHRATRLALISLAAALWALDVAGHFGLARTKALAAEVAADFEAAAEVMRRDPRPGGILALSGRYFYLRLPQLTGRPLLTEAYQSYLQPRGMAALSAAAFGSAAELAEYLRLAGARFVLLDTHDPDLPTGLAQQLRERLPQAHANANFEILEVPETLAPACLARDAVLLATEDFGSIAAALDAASGDILAVGPWAEGPTMGVIRDGALEFDPGVKARIGRPFERLPRVRRASAQHIEVEATAEGWVVVPESWHPDWQAGAAQAVKAFGALLAARVDAAGLVRFDFRPPWWYPASVAASGLAWAAALGLLVLGKKRLDGVPAPAPLEIPRGPAQRPLVVCPTYNEAETLPAAAARVFAAHPRLEMLVVDDGSPDGTAEKVRAHPEFGRRLHLLERPCKLGLGSAYRDGFAWAAAHGFDVCIEMDADLSHDPADIPRLLATLDAGADAVIGSRYLEGLRVVNWAEHRLLLSAVATQYVRLMTGLPLTDATSGFKALRRAALEKMDWRGIRAEGYGFQVELHYALWKAGARLAEVPITFTERAEGRTKMTLGIAWEAMRRVAELTLENLAGGRARPS